MPLQAIFAGEKVPNTTAQSLFLAGPTPRSKKVKSWRPDALAILEVHHFNGVVFVPEDRDGECRNNYDNQIEWEEECLTKADCILFWIPRDLETMPAFTTNIEWGVWCNSGKVVLGSPPNTPKMQYLEYYAKRYRVPVSDTLNKTINSAIELLQKK